MLKFQKNSKMILRVAFLILCFHLISHDSLWKLRQKIMSINSSVACWLVTYGKYPNLRSVSNPKFAARTLNYLKHRRLFGGMTLWFSLNSFPGERKLVGPFPTWRGNDFHWTPIGVLSRVLKFEQLGFAIESRKIQTSEMKSEDVFETWADDQLDQDLISRPVRMNLHCSVYSLWCRSSWK